MAETRWHHEPLYRFFGTRPDKNLECALDVLSRRMEISTRQPQDRIEQGSSLTSPAIVGGSRVQRTRHTRPHQGNRLSCRPLSPGLQAPVNGRCQYLCLVYHVAQGKTPWFRIIVAVILSGDPRIEPAVKHIRQEIDQYKDGGTEE